MIENFRTSFHFPFFSFRIPEILSSVCVKISFHRTMSYSLVARLFLLIVLIFISLSFREKYPRWICSCFVLSFADFDESCSMIDGWHMFDRVPVLNTFSNLTFQEEYSRWISSHFTWSFLNLSMTNCQSLQKFTNYFSSTDETHDNFDHKLDTFIINHLHRFKTSLWNYHIPKQTGSRSH